MEFEWDPLKAMYIEIKSIHPDYLSKIPALNLEIEDHIETELKYKNYLNNLCSEQYEINNKTKNKIMNKT